MLNKEKEYYVYALIDPRSNELFYIGKGKGKRATQHSKEILKEGQGNRSKLKVISEIKECGKEVKIKYIIRDINEEAAYFLEEILIDRIGRKLLRHGPLTNITVGGVNERHEKVLLNKNEKVQIEFAISKYPELKAILDLYPRTTKEDSMQEHFKNVTEELTLFLDRNAPNLLSDLEAKNIRFLDHPAGKGIQFECKFGRGEFNCDANSTDLDNLRAGLVLRTDGDIIFDSSFRSSFTQAVSEFKEFYIAQKD
jgi:hypothetical protein